VLAECSFNMEPCDEACHDYQASLERNPENDNARVMLGRIAEAGR